MSATLLHLAMIVGDVEAVAQRKLQKSNDRTLNIRSLPGYPGVRSDLYEGVGLKAISDLRAYDGEGNPIDGPRGLLSLEQLPNGVRITGTLKGLTPGLHGFHVHDKGDLTKGCISAGPHFNPYLVNHGGPHDPLRHVGDLGNVQAGEDGSAQVEIIDHYLSLIGARGAIGRSLVLHEKEDDLGRGRTEDSLKTGSAGGRIACGIVAFQ